jgi:uncharacterized protein YraI
MTFTRFAAAAAIVAALTAPAWAKPVTLTAETNLRKAPGTSSEIITLIPKGEKVETGSCDAGWCQVNWNGQDGYAIARNLGLAPPARRAARRYSEDYDEPEIVYGPGYVVGPPVYYGYYPYGPYYGGWRGGYGWRGGWRGRRW